MADLVDEILSGQSTQQKAAPRDLVDEILSGPSAPPPQAGPQVGYGEGIARAALQGLTFTYGDEMGAATYAAIPGLGGSQTEGWKNRYNENLESVRAKHKAFSKENPVASTGAEIAGSIVSAIPLAGAGAAGRVLAPSVGRTMLGTMARGAAAGATGGAIAGFGSGEGGFENRVGNAVIPAVVGGVVGAAAPPLVNMASRGFGKVADATGLRNNTRAAYRQTLRAIGRDQAAGGPGLDDIQRATAANVGDNYRPEMLPDIAGENVKTLASVATRTPGQAAQAGSAAIQKRVAEQAGRVSDDVARLVSPKSDFAGTVDGLLEQRAKDAKPAYEAAFQNSRPVEVNPILAEIDEALKTAKGGIKAALQNARSLFLNADGAVDTTLAGLHQTKMAMDDLIAARGDTSLGRTAKRQVIDIQNKLLAAMDDASTVNGTSLYKDARGLYAGPSKALDALEMGRAVLREDADVTAREIAAMTPNEKEFFLAGVARGIRDRLGGVGDNRNAVASVWGKPSLRDKLKAAFPDEASFKQFGALMDREMRMAETGNLINPRVGSHTQKLQAAERDMEIDPTVINDLRQGQPGKALAGGITRFFTNPPTQGMNSATADELARILYSTSQQENMQTLARLAREASRPGTLTERQMRDLARALSLGQGAAAGTQSN